ncbi:ABC transporter permease subunit [Acinetobacter soli]|nr:ABC transporter permease subunit [Acinetobacter soli]WEI08563.1 ABC transporter permease subunit [Acinetobacter soli]
MLTPEEISALYLSAKVGLFATLVNLPFAIFVAWILARYEFRLKVILESLLQLPMILPPVVLGYLLLILFGNRGILGQFLSEWGIQLAFNWKGAVIASMVVAFPLMVQPIRLSFQLINQQLEQIAQTLGASPIQAFFRLVCRLPCLVYLLEVFCVLVAVWGSLVPLLPLWVIFQMKPALYPSQFIRYYNNRMAKAWQCV